MTPLSEHPLLDLPTVAERTRISLRTWRRIIRDKKITILRIEGSIRIPGEALEEFLAACLVRAQEPARKAPPVSIEAIIDRHAPRKRAAK